jgi:hypothetical protein
MGTQWVKRGLFVAVIAGSMSCEDLDNPAGPSLPLASPEAEGDLALSAALETGYAADAFGTLVQVGTTITSDKTAPVGLACSAQPTSERSNTVATVDLSPAGTTGVVTTTAAALTVQGGGTAAKSTSTVHTVNLLEGLIIADEVRAVSQTQLRAGGFSTSAVGSGFVNLKVNGLAVAANVAPNTKISLPGYGFVILNEQSSKVQSVFGDLTVTMIRVVITQSNALGIPVNSRIVVSQAHSRVQVPGWTCACEGPLTGFAFGSQITGTVVKSGKTALVNLPCDGTGGNVRSKTVLTVDVSGVMELGQVVNTAEGTVDLPSAHGRTTSTMETVDLLDGLITADAIRAVTELDWNGGTPTTSTQGTGFVNLHVSGHPEIDANVSANSRIELSGVGTLWLRRIIQTSKGVEVRMIELVIEESNVYGIEVGTRIRIADSKVAIK